MKKVNTRACQNKSISDYVAILVFFGRFLKNWTHLVKIEAPILYETDLRYHTTKKFQNIDMIGVTFVFLTPHGMRICIKRKKIHYGKFFDFCAEKCVYN